MSSLLQDFRFAARQFRHNPGFATTTVLTLGLGIGAATAIFSLVDAVVLRPLRFPEPDRLFWLQQVDTSLPWNAKGQPVSEALSYPDFLDWRAQSHSFTGMASFHHNSLTLTGAGEPRQLDAETVASNYFRVLGVRPVVGRDFLPEDDKPGSQTVLLSYRLWQSAFGGAPGIAGRPITLDGTPYTVAGVMPPDVAPLEKRDPWLWVTMAVDGVGVKSIAEQRGSDNLSVVGRLKPGVSQAQAHAELTAIARHIAEQYPDTNKPYTETIVQPLLEYLVGDFRKPLRVLFGAVMLVLLIACANVAGLLLARASRRRSEIAVRSALGAGRGDILRQVLAESILLAAAGGLLGIALSGWTLETLVSLAPKDLPRTADVAVNGGVLAFAAGLSILAGLLFGIVPAWLMARLDPSLALRQSGRGMTAARGHQRLQSWLIVAETALGLALLAGSGLLIRSFVQVLRVNPGFDPHGVLTAQINLPGNRYPRERRQQFYDRLLANLSALPGVQSAAAGYPLPFSPSNIGVSFAIEGRTVAPGDEPSAALAVVTPGFFRTMRIPVLAGREFTPRDTTQGPPVIMINQAFAARYFPGENPLGKHVKSDLGDGTVQSPMREVVGIAGDVKRHDLTASAEAQYYLPYSQAVITSPTIAIRTAGDPHRLTGALRTQVAAADRELPLYRVETMDESVAQAASQPRFHTLLVSCFAAMALLLAAVGLYSVLSYMVSQRTLEIGLRMALGAQRTDVLRWVMRRGLGLAILGLAIGLGASAALTRFLQAGGMLYGVEAFDPPAFAGAMGVLLAVSLLASGVPALRASRLSPMATLREQ